MIFRLHTILFSLYITFWSKSIVADSNFGSPEWSLFSRTLHSFRTALPSWISASTTVLDTSTKLVKWRSSRTVYSLKLFWTFYNVNQNMTLSGEKSRFPMFSTARCFNVLKSIYSREPPASLEIKLFVIQFANDHIEGSDYFVCTTGIEEYKTSLAAKSGINITDKNI